MRKSSLLLSTLAILLATSASACEATPKADENACGIAAEVVNNTQALPITATTDQRKAILESGKARLQKPLPKVQSVTIRQLATTVVDQRTTGAEQDIKVWVELQNACKTRGHA